MLLMFPFYNTSKLSCKIIDQLFYKQIYIAIPLAIFIKKLLLGKCIGIIFVGSSDKL